MKPRPITVTTYNMHKGMSALNRKVRIRTMTKALQDLKSDVLFLQEVQGENLQRRTKLSAFPEKPHHDLIGGYLEYNSSYGKNAVYPEKHHGNAILSHLPIETHHNLNITVNKLEQRGLLHCEVQPEGWDIPLVCLCTHLNLLESDRAKQYSTIFEYVSQHIDPLSPLVIAGDFNDWRQKSQLSLGRALNLEEVFISNGQLPKTFPARMPILSLDRIYTRNLDVLNTQVHNSERWKNLSDHLPLSAKILPRLP